MSLIYLQPNWRLGQTNWNPTRLAAMPQVSVVWLPSFRGSSPTDPWSLVIGAHYIFPGNNGRVAAVSDLFDANTGAVPAIWSAIDRH